MDLLICIYFISVPCRVEKCRNGTSHDTAEIEWCNGSNDLLQSSVISALPCGFDKDVGQTGKRTHSHDDNTSCAAQCHLLQSAQSIASQCRFHGLFNNFTIVFFFLSAFSMMLPTTSNSNPFVLAMENDMPLLIPRRSYYARTHTHIHAYVHGHQSFDCQFQILHSDVVNRSMPKRIIAREVRSRRTNDFERFYLRTLFFCSSLFGVYYHSSYFISKERLWRVCAIYALALAVVSFSRLRSPFRVRHVCECVCVCERCRRCGHCRRVSKLK